MVSTNWRTKYGDGTPYHVDHMSFYTTHTEGGGERGGGGKRGIEETLIPSIK